MRKIHTLFVRDEADRRYVTEQVTPGCEWVLVGEGAPTRKYDGTCVMLDAAGWWARREVKPGKQPPPNFIAMEHDEITGKTVGWEPMEQSSYAKWHAEAVANCGPEFGGPGTFELLGPKVNGNPEHYDVHWLAKHEFAEPVLVPVLSFDGIRATVLGLSEKGFEGIVWHHPDGRMAKIKARDFRPDPA